MPDTLHQPDASPVQVGIGTPLSRVDGQAKVTGQARYAAEHPADGLLHAVAVSGRIARGRIVAIDETAARRVPGVVEVLTHRNRPHVAWRDSKHKDELSIPGEPFRALGDDRILFAGQPVALVIAETFEAARFAASLIDVSYEEEGHNIDFEASLAERFVPKKSRSGFQAHKDRGDADAEIARAAIRHDGTYKLATEHHNPMEMHATTVHWQEDGSITVYDKCQGAQGVQSYVSNVFGFPTDKVRVINAYVGGAFGSGLRPQYQTQLAMLAAKHLERSVRVVMTRQQMFTHAHRPEAELRVTLGAEGSGRLTAIVAEGTTSTSRFEDNMEAIVPWGMINYASLATRGDYAVAPRDTYTSADMRAPGAATGMTLFEMAMDEMAEAAGADPLEFRMANYSDIDAMNERPFTSKALREAYREAAARFGWEGRSLAPRSMREGRELIGWGMATGLWDAQFSKTSARARLTSDGRLEVVSATADIGTGSYTVMTQVAADTLGLPAEAITARLGDSDLPAAPVEGGSWGAASTGAAVQLVCRAVARQLLTAARKAAGDPLGAATLDEVRFADGRMTLCADPSRSVSLLEAMRAGGLDAAEAEETASPGLGGKIDQTRRSRNTHSAVFVEVRVDEELGVVRVTRVVSAVAAGRIINPKTARSQILGGVVMGIGMALHEETVPDLALGRWMNHSFAEYHIPAHADVADIEVIFVDEPDPEVTPLGVKGLGEIGIVGVAAAVANALWHATGHRQRSLPIHIEDVLGGLD